MKYDRKKIKREHNILKEFEKFVHRLATQNWVKRLIPGRISRSQSGSSREAVSFSYLTESGCKLLMKKGGTVQELFVIADNDDSQLLLKGLQDLGVEGVEVE